MKGLILSLIIFSIMVSSIDGQDDQNINKTLTPIGHQDGNCECIPYYLCESESKPAEEYLIDLHITDDYGPCNDYLLVCCKPEHKKEKTASSLSPEMKIKSQPCGISNLRGIDFRGHIRTEANVEAEYGEFPWTIAVLGEETVENSTEKSLLYQCGGSLIHPQVVLTIAHCVNSKDKKFSIRAGEWDSQSDLELFAHQERNVKNIILHPGFNNKTLINNVALLILDVPVEIMETVQTVCLPSPNDDLQSTTCVQSSWDKSTFGRKGKPNGILNRSRSPIVENHDCQERLRLTQLGEKFVLDKSFSCSESDDTCRGSGGSPFVCLKPRSYYDKYYLNGILSWGLTCAGNHPQIYTNIPVFRNWIDNEMLELNFGTSTYTV